jgi:hypothetical protein
MSQIAQDDMAPLDREQLSQLHAACGAATNHHERGTALENFASYVFEQLPGIEVRRRQVFSHADSQEVDIVLWNYKHANGLPFMDDILFVECKNWQSRVGSAEVAWLSWKLEQGGRRDGFLIVANGITGDPDKRTDAWDVLYLANTHNRRLILLTLEELANLQHINELVEIIRDRIAALALRTNPF